MSGEVARLAITVLCPMAIERTHVAKRVRRAGLESVEVAQCGVGKAAVMRAVSSLAEQPAQRRPTQMILAGVCGGLAEPNALTDLPWIDTVIDTHGRRWLQAPPPSAHRTGEPGVTLVAIDDIVATPTEKRELARRTGAAIVDMEAHGFIEACELHGFAWRIVRGVSDMVDDTLPKETLRWLTPSGDTRTLTAIADLACKPWLIPHVLAVLRRCNRVLPLVGDRVVEIARDWLASSPAPASSAVDDVPASSSATAPRSLPRDVRSVLLFGGTFDPPHRAHLELAIAARDAVMGSGAWLLLVPAARNPHKQGGPIASDADRLAMLRAAVADLPRVDIWTDEIDRAGASADPSYWVETLERARVMLPLGCRTRFLIGADQALQFHRWREPERILELAEPVVLLRAPTVSPERFVAEIAGLPLPMHDRWPGFLAPPSVPVLDVSATEVRDLLAASGTSAAARLERVLHPEVLAIIRRRGLYRRA